MKTKFLFSAFATALYATMNTQASQDIEKTVQLSKDQFREFLLNGKTDTLNTEKNLDTTQNKDIWVISNGYTKDSKGDMQSSKYIQPMKLINKTLLCYKNVIGPTKINGLLDLPIQLLKEEQNIFFNNLFFQYQLGADFTVPSGTLPYPGYPVVFREASDEKLSLQYLTALFRTTVKNINNSVYQALVSEIPKFANLWNIAIKDFENETDKFPEYLEALMKICNENKIEFNNDARKFKQDMEQLFYAMIWLSGRKSGADFARCLDKIYELKEKLMFIFNKNRTTSENNTDKLSTIQKTLTCTKNATSKNWEVKLRTRNFMAKALILDIFTHIDTAQNSMITDANSLAAGTEFLCKSYGAMANFIKHAKEHTHIYHEGDKIPFIPEKSYFVLKKGINEANFYDGIYDAIIVGEDAYNVNNVQIQKYMKDGIEIDIELSEEARQKITSNMVSSNGINKADHTSVIRLVIKENNGIFELVSAYPVKKEVTTIKSTETANDVYTTLGMYFMNDEINTKVKSGEIKSFRVIREYNQLSKVHQ